MVLLISCVCCLQAPPIAEGFLFADTAQYVAIHTLSIANLWILLYNKTTERNFTQKGYDTYGHTETTRIPALDVHPAAPDARNFRDPAGICTADRAARFGGIRGLSRTAHEPRLQGQFHRDDRSRNDRRLCDRHEAARRRSVLCMAL